MKTEQEIREEIRLMERYRANTRKFDSKYFLAKQAIDTLKWTLGELPE